MDPWTPLTRDEFISHALTSSETKGQKGPYKFQQYPKLSSSVDVEDVPKTLMTEALARTIFDKDPRYRIFSLKFYDLLIQKIKTSAFVNAHFMSTFYILLKGSTAYRFILGDAYAQDFPHSDLDIVIYINPFIPPQLFESLRSSLNSILLQVISQYKRALDYMLFLGKTTPECFIDEKTISDFKNDLMSAFNDISSENNMFLTPFESDEIRNSCSKYSFIIRDSLVQDNTVVRVEVPHYEKCERIPLRKTPIMASYNSSLNFQRENKVGADMKGEFDLYRLKITGMHVSFDEETHESKEHRIPMEFIDVSIANKDDAELISFWSHGRCIQLYDNVTNIWVTLPDINTCLQDLHKMLFVYECPEHKREKRMKKYTLLQSICTNIYM